MSYKRKAKIQKIIFLITFLVCCMFVGVIGGSYIAAFKKHKGVDFSLFQVILYLVLIIVVSYVAYFINICVHEIGHMVFGLLTGYRFSSIRFGKIMILKSEGKLKIKTYSIAGTGGQVIMLTPEGDRSNFPVFLYNVGGPFVNLIICIACLIGYVLLENKLSILAIVLLISALMSFTTFITNALPLSEMGTDGANAMLLHKNEDARVAFYNSMEIAYYLSNNVPVKDIPEQLFHFERETKMDNPLVTAQAISQFSYYVMNQRFEEAKEFGNYILEKALSINIIHELLIYSELLYILVAIEDNMDYAKEFYEKHKKEMQRVRGQLSVQRALYAYYSLCEINEEKANNCLKMFESIGKRYPYPQDFAIEKELLALVDRKIIS